MINIANILLTRKCNLSCEYCRISADINYRNKPEEYPSKSYYFKHEKDTQFWKDIFLKLYKHNHNIFLILYGGEPFLRKDLAELVNYCNEIGLNYTIISSCNSEIQSLIDEFFTKVEYVKGFTASVDPGFYQHLNSPNDIYKKANMGYKTLIRLKEEGLVKDPVAEITVSNYNLNHLYDTVKILTEQGICSDITFIDKAKNEWYDFSSITTSHSVISKDRKTKEIFEKLKESDLNIHMKDFLLNTMYEILPNDMDCEIENNLHNISIEPTGELRLCLRIRGIEVPKININDLIFDNGNINEELLNDYKEDKTRCCEGCFWSCMLMSKSNDNEGIINH